MKTILSQLKIALSGSKSYPSAYVWGYWAHTWKDGNCVYLQWLTLWNYIIGRKTLKTR